MLGFTVRIAVAIFLIICVFSESSKAQWQPVFSVSSLEIHALSSEGNTVIAGGNQRKVLYSSDQGYTWRNVSLNLPACHETIETLLTDGNHLWVVIPRLGIRRSTDGGVTWDWANDGLKSFRIHALVKQEEKLLAGTDAGVFVSTDKANHWQPLQMDFSTPQVSALYTQGDQIYAGTSTGELYYSSNQGKDWKILMHGVLRRPIQSIAVKNQVIYVGTFGQGVYHSSDRGESWNPVIDGLGAAYIHDLAQNDNKILAATDAGLYFLQEDSQQWEKLDGMNRGEASATYALHVQKNHIYAGTSRQGVLRSSDSGLHWDMVSRGAIQQTIRVLFDGGEQLYAGINNKIYTSTEAEYWQKAPDLSGTINHFTTSGKYLFAATNAGIYRKLSKEIQWTLVSKSLQINCIASFKNKIFAGTAKDGIIKSVDGGDTWEQTGLPEESILTLTTDEEYLFAGTQHGIFLSDDLGEHWQKVLENQEVVTLKAYQDKILSGTKNGIFLSSDAGRNWEQVEYDAYTYGIKNIIITPTSILMLDNAGRFFASYDKGNSWKPYELPVLGNITALAVYKGQIIAGTTDKGIWQHPLLPDYEDEIRIEPFSVYPNPASENLLINFPTVQTTYTISLKDVYGRTIRQYLPTSSEYKLDISQLPIGTYFLQISGNGEKVIKRIIKLN